MSRNFFIYLWFIFISVLFYDLLRHMKFWDKKSGMVDE